MNEQRVEIEIHGEKFEFMIPYNEYIPTKKAEKRIEGKNRIEKEKETKEKRTKRISVQHKVQAKKRTVSFEYRV